MLEAMTALGEREALALLQNGQDDALRSGFRWIYEQYFDEVHRFQERLLGDPNAADDATQETFVRLHRAVKSFDAGRPLRPYVLAIARNVAIDVLRARAKTAKLRDEHADPVSGGVVEEASRRERRDAVEAALAALAPEHRSILLLRHVSELKLEEIADGSSCTVRTVRNRLRAAGTLLGRELRRRGIVGDTGSTEVRS